MRTTLEDRTVVRGRRIDPIDRLPTNETGLESQPSRFSAGMWDTSTGLYRIGEERVRAHQNDIYVLYGFDQEASARAVAGHFSFVFDRGGCQAVENRLQPVGAPDGPILLCLLRRAEGAP